MSSKSQITLTGNVTHDPELTFLASGVAKLTFSLAVGHRYRQNEEWVESTSYFRVVAWRNTAEQAAEIITKGMGLTVNGRQTQRQYEDNDGQKRSIVECVADEISVNVWSIDSLERRVATGGGSQTPKAKQSSAPSAEESPW